MKIAKVLQAVNTPLTIDMFVSIGKRELRVSLFDTVVRHKGAIVGYTKLEKTSDSTKDRIQIGNKEYLTYDIPPVAEVNTDSIKYCICTNDISNEWIAVVSGIVTFIIDDCTDTTSHHSSLLKLAFVAVSAGLLITGKLLNNFSWNDNSVAETQRKAAVKTSLTNEIARGDVSDTEYSAQLSDNPTSEELLNYDIAKSNAEPGSKPKPLTRDILTNGSEPDSKTSIDGMNTSTVVNTEHQNDSQVVEPQSDAPFSSIRDTVIVSPSGNLTSEDDPVIVIVPPAIGSITLSQDVETYTLTNSSEYKMNVRFLLKKKTVAEYVIDAGKSVDVNLLSKFEKTCKPTIVYDYLDSNGKTVRSFRAGITVYVI